MNKTQQLLKSREEEFDKEFTFKGHFGEKKFTYFRTNNYTKETPIVLDDKVIEDLKSFHATTISLLLNSLKEEIGEIESNIHKTQTGSSDYQAGQLSILSHISTLLSEIISNIQTK